jgi:hypothetical protein
MNGGDTNHTKKSRDGEAAKMVLVMSLVILAIAWGGMGAQILFKPSRAHAEIIGGIVAIAMIAAVLSVLVGLGACIQSLFKRRWFLAFANAAATGGVLFSLPAMLDSVFSGAGWGRPLGCTTRRRSMQAFPHSRA